MMVGIDILEIKRMKKFVNNIILLKSVFTDKEIEYFARFQDPIERITGCFCAKEAVQKAFSCPKDLSLKNIEVLHKENGKPYINFVNLSKYHNYNIDISISHSKTVACAICHVKD